MLKKTLLLLIPLVVLTACQTIDTNIPEGSTPEIYFQRAQMANDNSDYDTALLLYQKFLNTNPDDKVYRLSAQYEIALIHFKTGKKPLAKQEFLDVLGEYKDSTKSATLPSWIRILSEKKLAEMPNVKTPGEQEQEAQKLAAEKAAKEAAAQKEKPAATKP